MTTAVTMRDVRQVTPLAAPRTGLLVAARTTNDLTNVRWGMGVTWLDEMHKVATSAAFGARLLEDAAGTNLGHVANDKAPTETADPFLVYAFDWCSSMEGFAQRDWQGRARRLLEATQSRSIAREFWSGAITQAAAPDLSNTWLAKSSVTLVNGTTAMTPQKALALLDDTVINNLANGQGMVHCTPQTKSRLVDLQAIWPDTTGLHRSANGTIVCADAGYVGQSLDGQTGTWMVATTVPEIVLGPVRALDPTPAGGTLIERSVNDVFMYAERDVLVMHSPSILHAAVKVDLS